MKKIGTITYLLAKSFKGKEYLGACLIPAKIVGYQNIGGKILPILKSGGKEQSPELNHIFYDLQEGINQLKGKK